MIWTPGNYADKHDHARSSAFLVRPAAGSPGRRPGRRYAKAIADWSGTPAPAVPTVYAHPCADMRGNDVNTSVDFLVYLPRIIDADPAIYKDNIFAWEYDYRGIRVGAGNYFNGKVGDLRATVMEEENWPEGWELCNGEGTKVDLRGRTASGWDPRATDETNHIGATFGERHHGPKGNNHDDHQPHVHPLEEVMTIDDVGNAMRNPPGLTGEADGHQHEIDFELVETAHSDTFWGGVEYPGTTGPNDPSIHSETDNRGPRTTVVWIQRVK